jgi:U3 small nucleolar RNA-associated protein 13
MDPESHAAKCVGVGSRHTLSVGSVAVSQLSASFFLSVSQDLCLKLWKIPKKLNSGNEADTSEHNVNLDCAVKPLSRMAQSSDGGI